MALTDQGRNIEAIERYIGEQVPPVTPAAVSVRDSFLRFAAGLSDWERNFEQQAYDRARNFRLEYNRANATTPAEKAAVEQQARAGLSTEQIDGQADRRTSDGSYVPPPSTTKQIAVAALVVIGALFLLKR